MTSTRDRRFNNIIAKSITANLKQLGFQKRGNVYTKTLEELSWIISVQKSQWNTQKNSLFTLNCGVYVPRVISIYSPALFDRIEPQMPKLTDCCIYSRFGMLTKSRQDKWWQLDADDLESEVDPSVIEDVSTQVEQIILPFLGRFVNRDSVIDFLARPRPEHEKQIWPQSDIISMIYLSILYFLCERRDESCSAITSIEVKKDYGGLREDITRLRQYLCSQ